VARLTGVRVSLVGLDKHRYYHLWSVVGGRMVVQS